jgi:HK97 family phage prohead protease
MEQKIGPGGLQVKDRDGQWTVSGYASVFSDVPDLQGDRILPGAFSESIARTKTKLLFQHRVDDIIGAQLAIKEDRHGLWGEWSISKTPLGEQVHTLLLDGALDSFSIGYFVQEEDVLRDGTRLLKKLEVPEVSVVVFPAQPSALVSNVKRRGETQGRVNDLAVDLEIHRRKLVQHRIIPGEGPLSQRIYMAGRRIRARELGVRIDLRRARSGGR